LTALARPEAFDQAEGMDDATPTWRLGLPMTLLAFNVPSACARLVGLASGAMQSPDLFQTGVSAAAVLGVTLSGCALLTALLERSRERRALPPSYARAVARYALLPVLLAQAPVLLVSIAAAVLQIGGPPRMDLHWGLLAWLLGTAITVAFLGGAPLVLATIAHQREMKAHSREAGAG
jgi:hypothetical protein